MLRADYCYNMVMIFATIATIGYLLSVWLIHRHNKVTTPAVLITMSVAFITHTIQAVIGLQGAMNDVSIMNMLSVIAVSMVFVGAWRYFAKADNSAYTVVALIAAVCVWFPVWFNIPLTQAHGWSLKFHIVLSIAAYIALGFASLYACFLLIQDMRLRNRKAVFNLNLPLNYIERTMFNFTVIGEVLLTLSLVTGLLFIHDFWAQHISHKVTFAVVSWLIIAVLLMRYYHQGFRGRKAALWLLSGFVFLLLAYLGSAFVLQIILHR